MERPIARELLDHGWLGLYGQEATALGLTKAEMEMCKGLGVTPTQFKASKDHLESTEAMVEGRKPNGETARAKAVDLFQARASGDEPLTPEQLKMCLQLGITTEEFRKEMGKLAMANLV